MRYLHVIICICLAIATSLSAKKADLVVFSYDRPMQLYAFLESTYMYLDNLGEIRVIYRASDERYEASYCIVKEDFPNVFYMKQGNSPQDDFKPLTLEGVYGSPHEYVLFAVDDIIIKDFADLSYCIHLMEQTNAYGFYLRLGTHLNYCYTQNKSETPPQLKFISDDVGAWTLYEGTCEWRYPNTVDMTIYNKKEIEPVLRTLQYTNPNTFEGRWAGATQGIMQRTALCFKHSKMVNLPLNRVQSVYNNRHMDAYSPLELLEMFERGYKIDIHDLYKIENKSPHMEYTPRFVVRPEKPKQDGTKHFVVLVASYNNEQWYQKNLDTLFAQQYENYEVIYIDDCSPDGTGNLVEAYIKERNLESKVTLIKNKVRLGGPLENHYRACHFCKDDYVIVILDGDDFFAHDQVLAYLNRVYQDSHVWMTYGQFKEVPSETLGFCCPMPKHIVEQNAFRDFSHIPSHLRSFYAGLFNQIKKEDLMMNGEFFKMAGDMAAMIPMIEMAREGHFRFISDVLYLYNAINPLSEHRISKEQQRAVDLEIRRRPRYAPAVSNVRS